MNILHRTRSSRIVSLSFLLILACALSAFPQQKPSALKFDVLTAEYDHYYRYDDPLVKQRIDRFVAEAKRQPGKTKYLVRYRARVRQGGVYSGNSNDWATTAKHAVAAIGKTYDESDIVVVDGGVRENETLEFWFVPKGVDLPTPTPEFDRSTAIDCPQILAYQAGYNFDKEKPVVLTAGTRPDDQAKNFEWIINEGKVISDIGTVVEIDVSRVKENKLTAFLEVKGLPPVCKSTATVVAEFGNTARLFDSFGRLPNGDIRSRLDAFAQDISKHPGFHGYFYNYGDRVDGDRQMAARRRLFASHYQARNFDKSRVTIVDAGYREEIHTDVWLVPPGVKPPDATPTVDSSFIIRPSARKRPRK